MANQLSGCKVAILVTDGFEQVEMTKPREALKAAGAETILITPQGGKVQGWKHDEKADSFPVDMNLGSARPDEFDALLLPGGVANPDKLRTVPEAVAFVQGFVRDGKAIAAICHGPWLLVEAGAVKGRRLTSWPSLKTDIRNAGGNWEDKEVVVDHLLLTSRKPDDIPAFNKAMVELFQMTKSKVA